MHSELWSAVDRYLCTQCVGPDAALDAALADSAAAGLPAIHVAPNQGKLLALFVQMLGARRVLELGTLGGYSTIWMARSLPADGRLVTLEADARHAAVARQNLSRAGVLDRVELRLGAALETLPQLARESLEPFDFTFIDADKTNIAAYFDWAIRLSHPGSVIVVDNVVREGEVANAASMDERVRGVHRFFEQASRDPRVTLTALQTVGSKGYDGFALARVLP